MLAHAFASLKITAMALLLTLLAPEPGSALHADEPAIPPPLGPYIHPRAGDFARASTFHATDRLVMTYYFYWYDSAANLHITNADGSDGLTDHPPALADFSFRSVPWHQRQLSDMIDAGIDIVLPVYCGAPSERGDIPGCQSWSYTGLKPMVQAAEELEKQGKQPPRIGLFYDTSTLQQNAWHQHIDLTTLYGKQWFYASIRDFFSLIPPRYWAMIDGKPIVVLYSASFARAYDQGCIDYVRRRFAQDFGARVPYIVRETSWKVQADDSYTWGGAIRPSVNGIAELGPGYDHSHVPSRPPLVVKRDGGRFYEAAWQTILRSKPRIVALETWNEFHEGTEICESKEYGRQYITLTRKYVDLFKSARQPVAAARTYAGAAAVEVVLGKDNRQAGLEQLDVADGVTLPVRIGGKDCRATQPAQEKVAYVYLALDKTFKWADAMNVMVDVEYFDRAPGSFAVEYDSHDAAAPVNGAYKRTAAQVLLGDGRWKTVRFTLTQARFRNSQNGGADLRLFVNADAFAVRRVVVRR